MLVAVADVCCCCCCCGCPVAVAAPGSCSWLLVTQHLVLCASPAFDSLSGCPQYEVPRAGAPAPVHAAGVHRHGQVASEPVVPQSRQPRQQAAETRRCQIARRRAGRQAGAHRRGEDTPFTRSVGLTGRSRLCSGSKFYFNLRNLTEPAVAEDFCLAADRRSRESP
jgi:hypothetical protein